MALQLTTAAVNVPRDSHYERNATTGLYERAVLLEGARTNALLWSQAFTNAAWSKDAGLAAADNQSLAPDGTLTSATLTEGGAGTVNRAFQTLPVVAGQPTAVTVYAKAGTQRYVRVGVSNGGGWVVIVDLQTGTITQTYAAAGWTLLRSAVTALANGWSRIEATGSHGTLTTYSPILGPHDNSAGATDVSSYTGAGKTVSLWGGQSELNASFASSYVATTAAAATRSADVVSLPFPYAPMELTLYARCYERGTILTTNGARLAQIGASGNTAPACILYAGGGVYQAQHNNNVAVVSSSLAVAPSIGDLVELRAVLRADGSVQIGQSINSAAETLGAQSAGNALATAWSDTTLWAGSVGGAFGGFVGLAALKTLRGVQTMAAMRSA
jgi:hypothetical protein